MTSTPPKYVVLDLETTGLDVWTAEPLEIACVLYDPDGGDLAPHGKTLTFVPYHDPREMARTADFGALAVNRYFERRLFDVMSSPGETDKLLGELLELLDGATLVGANPAYDAAVLWPWLRRRIHGDVTGPEIRPPWHFRLFDVEAATMVAHDLERIPSLKRAAELWHVPAPPHSSHTALGDALVTCEVFHAIRVHSAAVHAFADSPAS